jgi:hypothetical protein
MAACMTAWGGPLALLKRPMLCTMHMQKAAITACA